MNIFLLFFLFLIASVNTTLPMWHEYFIIHEHLQTHTDKKENNFIEKLGTLVLKEAQKESNCYQKNQKNQKNQKKYSENDFLLINSLSLPVEVSNCIFFKLCNEDQQMLTNFSKRPLGKALEWLSLMQEKYQKDTRLSSLIPFPTLYCIPKKSIIELARTTSYFSRNKTDLMEFSPESCGALRNLPNAIKICNYFQNKNFTSNYFYTKYGTSCNTTASYCVAVSVIIPLELLFIDKFLYKYRLSRLTRALICTALLSPPLLFTWYKIEKKLNAYYFANYQPKEINNL